MAIISTVYTLALGLGTLKQRFLVCRRPLDSSHYLDVDKFFVSPSQGPVTQKGQQTFEFGGASGTLPRDQKQALQREDTLHMDPHAKVSPNRQFASGNCPLFSIMKACN